MKDIRLLVLDVDGTLTDGKIYMGAEGEVCKAFSIKDGLGLRLMADSGVTLAVLTGGAGAGALAGIFTPLTAYVFLVFILLYVPCLATFATTRKELGSTWQALLCVASQIAIAYAVCFCIYHLGLLFV